MSARRKTISVTSRYTSARASSWSSSGSPASSSRAAGLAPPHISASTAATARASPAVLDELDGEPELAQLLARALVYRLVTEIVFRRGDPDPSAGLETVARTSQPVTVLVLARLAVR